MSGGDGRKVPVISLFDGSGEGKKRVSASTIFQSEKPKSSSQLNSGLSPETTSELAPETTSEPSPEAIGIVNTLIFFIKDTFSWFKIHHSSSPENSPEANWKVSVSWFKNNPSSRSLPLSSSQRTSKNRILLNIFRNLFTKIHSWTIPVPTQEQIPDFQRSEFAKEVHDIVVPVMSAISMFTTISQSFFEMNLDRTKKPEDADHQLKHIDKLYNMKLNILCGFGLLYIGSRCLVASGFLKGRCRTANQYRLVCFILDDMISVSSGFFSLCALAWMMSTAAFPVALFIVTIFLLGNRIYTFGRGL